jgi:hypothetical protein
VATFGTDDIGRQISKSPVRAYADIHNLGTQYLPASDSNTRVRAALRAVFTFYNCILSTGIKFLQFNRLWAFCYFKTDYWFDEAPGG